MKNIIFSILLVLISLNGYSQTSKFLNYNKEEKYIKTDKKSGSLYYKDILYSGNIKYFYKNGMLLTKGKFINGVSIPKKQTV